MTTIPSEPGEIWRDVPGYEGLYSVSNRGRVWSFPRATRAAGGMLKGALRGHPGYERFYVTLCKGSRDTNWSTSVHQLVMLAFAGPCPEGQEVRHLDGDAHRNWWEPGDEAETRARGGNLFYGTHKQNGEDMAGHGSAKAGAQRGTEHYRAKLTEDLVRQLRAEYAAGGVTERDLASRHGVNVGTIHHMLVRNTWKHVA